MNNRNQKSTRTNRRNRAAQQKRSFFRKLSRVTIFPEVGGSKSKQRQRKETKK